MVKNLNPEREFGEINWGIAITRGIDTLLTTGGDMDLAIERSMKVLVSKKGVLLEVQVRKTSFLLEEIDGIEGEGGSVDTLQWDFSSTRLNKLKSLLREDILDDLKYERTTSVREAEFFLRDVRDSKDMEECFKILHIAPLEEMYSEAWKTSARLKQKKIA